MIHYSPEQIAAISVNFAAMRFGMIPWEHQCVNLGATECEGWALSNGWCRGCSALLFPEP